MLSGLTLERNSAGGPLGASVNYTPQSSLTPDGRELRYSDTKSCQLLVRAALGWSLNSPALPTAMGVENCSQAAKESPWGSPRARSAAAGAENGTVYTEMVKVTDTGKLPTMSSTNPFNILPH